MLPVIKDRVRETTHTAGIGALLLSGAQKGYQPFSVIGANNYCKFCIYDAASGDWEVTWGQWQSVGPTLIRTIVEDSSNMAGFGHYVNFKASPKVVFLVDSAASIPRIAQGKSLTVLNTLTLAGTDSSTLDIGSGGVLGTAAFTDVSAGAAGLIATHAALTTGVHGLAITAGQTLTVPTGGTIGT